MAEYIVVLEIMVGDEIEEDRYDSQNGKSVHIEQFGPKGNPILVLVSSFKKGVCSEEACYKSNNDEDVAELSLKIVYHLRRIS